MSETIELRNPEKQNFESFIVGNALRWQASALAEIQERAPADVAAALTTAFENEKPGFAFSRLTPFRQAMLDYCAQNFVVEQNSAEGQELVIAGAGPSLCETAAKWCPQADQVWGCNSAATWLYNNGHKITHGFTVDQTTHMVEEWINPPPIDYYVASTVHPHLTDNLRAHGRPLTFFHNYVGIDKPPVEYDGRRECYEDWLYACLYPPTIRVGSGLNAVTRAIDLALFLGFRRITVLGSDCCVRTKRRLPKETVFGSPEHKKWLKEETIMHADGGSAVASEASAMTMEAIIDSGTPDKRIRKGHGRHWVTKPDMIITAIWLLQMKRELGPRLRIMGDTIVKALMGKSEDYIKGLPRMVGGDGEALQFSIGEVVEAMTTPIRAPVPVTHAP